jgi:PII-like signaling protein
MSMKGFQITFFTQQDKRHGHTPMAEWLMLTARELGLRGATVVAASEGFGQHRRIHSAHFFELADQPQEVVMTATEEEWVRLVGYLEQEGVRIFYVKCEIEFGVIGDPGPDSVA